MIHPVSAALSSMADLPSRTLHAVSLQSLGRCCRTWSPGASYWGPIGVSYSFQPPSVIPPEYVSPIRGVLLRGASHEYVSPIRGALCREGGNPFFVRVYVPPSSLEQRITKSSNSVGSCVLYPCHHDWIHEVPFLVIFNKVQHLECFNSFLHTRGRHVIPL